MNPSIDQADASLDLSVVLELVREWQEANRAAVEVQAALPAEILELYRSAGVNTPADIRARWVAAVAGLHPTIVATYAGLLDYVVEVLETLERGQVPAVELAPVAAAEAGRIAELEARIDELETMIAGAGAVLRAAEVG